MGSLSQPKLDKLAQDVASAFATEKAATLATDSQMDAKD